MIEKPKRSKQLTNQERKIPADIQELITRYDLDNIEIYDYLDKLINVELLNFAYPIGSIYLSVNPVNPSTIIGGEWIQWGSGKTIIGVDSEDADFNTVEKTGGEKEHTLTENEMPSHNHAWDGVNATAGVSGQSGNYPIRIWEDSKTNWTGTRGNIKNSGGNQAHNNLQPYITCYMWKRIK